MTSLEERLHPGSRACGSMACLACQGGTFRHSESGYEAGAGGRSRGGEEVQGVKAAEAWVGGRSGL
jgi:hypothetical protein